MDVSKTRQSEFWIALATPSWIDRGVASQVRRRRCPFSSNLQNTRYEHLWNDFVALNDVLVSEVLCLLPCSYQLHDREELLMPIHFFLLFKNEHEMVTKT